MSFGGHLFEITVTVAGGKIACFLVSFKEVRLYLEGIKMYKVLFFGLVFSVLLLTYKNNNSSCINGNVNMCNDENMTINGSAKLKDQSFKNLTVNGSAKIKDVTVSESTIVNGSAQLKDTYLGLLTVNGSADLKDVVVKETVAINGSGNFKDCKLNDLKLRGSQFDFKDTLVRGNIHVKTIGIMTSKRQLIVLKDTVVSRDITFDSGNGIIELEGESKITGKVIGGIVN